MASPQFIFRSSSSNNLTSASSSIPMIPDPFRQLLHQMGFSTPFLILGGVLTYCVNYTVVTRNRRWQNIWTALAFAAFAFTHFGTPVDCPPFAAFRNCPISICFLKVMDMWMRRDAPLRYKHSKPLPVPHSSEESDETSTVPVVDNGPPAGLSPSPSPVPTPIASPAITPKLSTITSRKTATATTSTPAAAVTAPQSQEKHLSPSSSNPATKPHKDEPSKWIQAFLMTTQLRYESFTPNPIRVIPNYPLSEPLNFIIHLAVFVILQNLPQTDMVIAFEVLLSVWLIFTGIQLVLRFSDSPPVMSPLYTADSIAGFWTETWHNAFTSPVTSIAYDPVRNILQKMGAPRNLARSMGLISAFGLMGLFHVYFLLPLLPIEGTFRVGMFFLVNGIATAVEVGVWGRRRNWIRRVLAWGFEIAIATWTVNACRMPKGLNSIQWAEICSVVSEPEATITGWVM